MLIDGQRKVLHDQETTTFKGGMKLVFRAFSQLFGKISKEQALCEDVRGKWWQRIKFDSILHSRLLFLKEAHCALATESYNL